MTPDQIDPNIDVIVVGAGNAAMNAALAAKESGASVVMLEAAPESARSGNSAFTGGAFRFVYQTVDDLLRLAPDIAEVTMRAENTIALEGDEAQRMQKLLDVIEDLDDVQAVFHNAEMP